MNKVEYLLTCLIEECAEIQKAATKALRFGLNDQYKDTTPAQDISRECCDLIAVIEMLEEEGIIEKTGTIRAIEQKKVRVNHYMEYAIERGTLAVEDNDVCPDCGERHPDTCYNLFAKEADNSGNRD